MRPFYSFNRLDYVHYLFLVLCIAIPTEDNLSEFTSILNNILNINIDKRKVNIVTEQCMQRVIYAQCGVP